MIVLLSAFLQSYEDLKSDGVFLVRLSALPSLQMKTFPINALIMLLIFLALFPPEQQQQQS